MEERAGQLDYIKALRSGWAEPILKKIPRNLLLDLAVQFDAMSYVADRLIKEKGEITTADVLSELDRQLTFDNLDGKPKSIKETDKMYRENRKRIKSLLDQFYPDTGRINQGLLLHEITLDFIKLTSK